MTVNKYQIPSTGSESESYMIDDQEVFEMIKLEVRGKTIQYSSRLKKGKMEAERKLESEVAELERIIN